MPFAIAHERRYVPQAAVGNRPTDRSVKQLSDGLRTRRRARNAIAERETRHPHRVDGPDMAEHVHVILDVGEDERVRRLLHLCPIHAVHGRKAVLRADLHVPPCHSGPSRRQYGKDPGGPKTGRHSLPKIPSAFHGENITKTTPQMSNAPCRKLVGYSHPPLESDSRP